MSTREDLITRLETLPGRLAIAEAALLEAEHALSLQKARLDGHEADVTLAGLEGRNAEERKAYLHRHTLAHQEAVRIAQDDVARAALQVRILQAEFSAARSLARYWQERTMLELLRHADWGAVVLLVGAAVAFLCAVLRAPK